MPINDQAFKYVAFGGTRFISTRSDLQTGLLIQRPEYSVRLDEAGRAAKLAADIMDMTSYFMLEIFPKLNGFGGWPSVKITIED